jgi:hypothetical protein
MHRFFHPSVIALSAVCFVVSMAIVFRGDALAQVGQQTAVAQIVQQKLPVVKQRALTGKQIRAVLSAIKDMDKITENSPDDINSLSTETIRQLDAIAGRNGLSSYEEYKNVVENISLVTAGFDPATRKYIGMEALIKAKIARIRADKKLSEDRRKEALTELNDQLQFVMPAIQNKGNIALVAKYYDRLDATMRNE